jgi:hypothetical protein
MSAKVCHSELHLLLTVAHCTDYYQHQFRHTVRHISIDSPDAVLLSPTNAQVDAPALLQSPAAP